MPAAGGGVAAKEIIVHPGAVVILPLLDDRTVVMIRNRRVAVGETLLELPAGTLEPAEEPLRCAAREVIEETGYRAGRIEPLIDFFTSPGICTERMFAFVARDLVHQGQDLDDTEQITPEPVALARTFELIRTGVIRDGKSIATLLYFDRLMLASRGGL